ncbi:doublesex- and mab-3-related transcription factor 1 isoform X2 [Halichoeres trimaculatus]|uniref:doublesex- and mab-3-related transcription factor 1 isoform X2 n=1 Tax=Halichoeres trimaculatus TaxID=147232 RepID=UPI003D9EA6DB
MIFICTRPLTSGPDVSFPSLQVALRRQQAQEEELGICTPVSLATSEVMVKNEAGPDCLFSVDGHSPTPTSTSASSLSITVFHPGSRSALSPSPSAGSRALTEGQSDLLLETSYYNFYQPGRYPTYYSNLYNYQQYQQMPHGDSPLTSHNVSTQYRMHSYYPAATYLPQGLGSTFCVPPRFSMDDNNNCSDTTMAASFSPGGISTPQDSTLTCRSISCLVNSDISTECETNSETPDFTVNTIMDGDATK